MSDAKCRIQSIESKDKIYYASTNACKYIYLFKYKCNHTVQTYIKILKFPQPAITGSKLTIKALEQRCEICSKLTIKTPLF